MVKNYYFYFIIFFFEYLLVGDWKSFVDNIFVYLVFFEGISCDYEFKVGYDSEKICFEICWLVKVEFEGKFLVVIM